MKKYIFVFMAMLAIMLAVGCTGDSPEYQDGNSQANAQAPESEDSADSAGEKEAAPAVLEILDHSLGKEEYVGYVVTGTAQAGEDLGYAEVRVKFYDESGALIGSGIALGAGKK